MAAEAAQAVADVAALIQSTGEMVKILKVTPQSEGGFAGKALADQTVSAANVPALLMDKQPSDLLQVDHDYMVSLLPGTEVVDTYLLQFRGATFEVVDIKQINLFGTVTHLEVAVKKQRGI